jgi:hypothetical protein
MSARAVFEVVQARLLLRGIKARAVAMLALGKLRAKYSDVFLLGRTPEQIEELVEDLLNRADFPLIQRADTFFLTNPNAMTNPEEFQNWLKGQERRATPVFQYADVELPSPDGGHKTFAQLSPTTEILDSFGHL